MKVAALGDVCTIVMGQAPKGESYNDRGKGIPLIAGAGDFKGGRLAPIKFTTQPTRLAQADDIVLSIRASIGNKVWSDGSYCVGRGVAALRPKEELDRRYLWHWLSDAESALAAKGRGATFLQVSRWDIAEMPIAVPALEEQRRIAAILDDADALRAKRRQVLAHLDDLTQSIFHGMFDPSEGEEVRFGDVVTAIGNGTSPKCESRPASPHEWGVLKLGAVTYGVFDQEENKAFLGDVGSMVTNEVRPGDVLMTRKNTRDLVGAVAVVGENVRSQLLLPDLIFRLSLDKQRLRANYFHALMSTARMRHAVRNLSSGSAASMPNISKARLRELPLRLPDLSLQAQFERRAASIDMVRRRVRRAMAADDELFASLQSRAFKGEL